MATQIVKPGAGRQKIRNMWKNINVLLLWSLGLKFYFDVLSLSWRRIYFAIFIDDTLLVFR